MFLGLHYNGVNSCTFVKGVEIYKFKTKDSETSATSSWLFLGNVSNGFSVDNTENIYVDMFMIFNCLW